MNANPDRVELELAFRGARDYIQGADIYEAIVGCVGQRCSGPIPGPVRIQMHSLARAQCDLIVGPRSEPIARPEMGRAEFTLRDWHGWLVESSRPVTRRLPYDESGIASRCRVSRSIIRVVDKPPNSTIEVLIAATKILHQTLYPLENKKWIVSRLELDRTLDAMDAGMEVELLHNLNNRLTRSVVRCGAGHLGHVYFSAVRP